MSYGLLLALPVEAFALFGAGDSVVVVGDVPGAARHAEQMAQWSQQIAQAVQTVNRVTRLVQQTDQLLSIIGDPSSVAESVSTLSGATEQLHQIFRTDTTRGLRDMVRGQQALDKATNKLRTTVEGSVLVGGKRCKRRASLYDTYALLERMHDNFENIAAQDRKVQQREVLRQERLHRDLINAKTEWERERIKAAMAASKALQDASSQSVNKAKQSYEAETIAREVEHQKQALAQWEAKRFKEAHQQQQIAQTNQNLQQQIDREVVDTVPYETRLRVP